MDLTGWWYPLLSITMGVGAAILTLLGSRYYGTSRPHRSMKEWYIEAERRMLTAVQADLYAAEARASLVELIGTLPTDFDATILLAVNIGSAFQRAAIYEAEAKGLVPSGTFSRLYGVSFEGEADRVRVAPIDQPPTSVAPPTSEEIPIPRESAKWIGSHKVE